MRKRNVVDTRTQREREEYARGFTHALHLVALEVERFAKHIRTIKRTVRR